MLQRYLRRYAGRRGLASSSRASRFVALPDSASSTDNLLGPPETSYVEVETETGVETEAAAPATVVPADTMLADDVSDVQASVSKWWQQVREEFFESRGILPVGVEEQTDKKYISIFTLWLGISFCVLPLPFGILGTTTYQLSLGDASLVIIFFGILTTVPLAYFATLGPKLGFRQMIIARYSFGRYVVSFSILLNLAILVGFCIINDTVGGGMLAAASGDSAMSWSVGIVIIAILSLFISAWGYRLLHIFEGFAWIAALICLIITAGIAGPSLKQRTDLPPATASSVLTFGSLIAGYYISWAIAGSDFTIYMRPDAPPARVFLYTYLGLLLPSTLIFIFGAAIGGSIALNPSWADAWDTGSIGLILAEVLAPAGRFGKFLLVILAFSIISNLAGTMYVVGLNFQALVPGFTRIPRFLFIVVATIIMIPVAIKATDSFFNDLNNFVGIVAYWSSSWAAVVMCEHVVFRASKASNYDRSAWNKARQLPPGVAALLASTTSFGVAIPSMSQAWYVGPIGAITGDIGFELAFVISFLLYIPLRYIERAVVKR